MNPHYHTAGWPVSWAKLGQLLLVLHTLSRLGQLVLVHSFMIITTVSNTGCIFSYGFRHVRQIHVLCVALSDLMPALSEATQCLNQGLLPCGDWWCVQLPVYTPSSAERADPLLYAANMHSYMVSNPP